MKEKDPSEEQPKFLVLFSSSRSTKLSFYITTDKLARSGLITGENDSLGGREPENETDNFGSCPLGCTVLNWKIVYHSEWIMRPNMIF